MSDGGTSKLAERPTQLLVKASFDRANGLTRRIPFRDLTKVTFNALEGRVAECFALSSNFSIAYKDDDGDEIAIESDDDLAEALDYMQSGEEGYTSKCVMKVFIVLGYEGPNLSQSGTFLSERTRRSELRRTDHYGSETNSNGRRRLHATRGVQAQDGMALSQSSSNSSEQLSGLGNDLITEQRQWWERSSRYGEHPPHISHSHARGPSDLREGVLDSNPDGRAELGRRWLLESSQGSLPCESSLLPVNETASERNDTLAIFRQEELDRLNSLIQTSDSPERLRCRACEGKMVDLRFVCMACGPLEQDSLSPFSDNDPVSSNHSSTVDTKGEASGDTRRGYELCESCIEVHGSKHSQMEDSDSVHVFIEAHKALNSRGWRVVEYAETPACNVCGTGPLSLRAHRCLVCAHCDMCSACFAAVKDNHAGHAFQILPPVFSSSTTGPHMGLGRGSIRRSSLSSRRSARSRSGNLSSQSSIHTGCHCQGCGYEISGPRYSCATCSSFDLCSSCEEDEAYDMGSERGHDSTHIMLKAKLPLPDHAFRQARNRAESLASGYEGDRSSVGGYVQQSHPHHRSASPNHWRHGPPPGPSGHFERGPPPHHGRWGPPPPWDWTHGPGPGPGPHPPPPSDPWHHPWGGPNHHGHRKGPHGPPPIYLINTGGAGSASSVQRLDSLEQLNLANAGRMNLPHNVSCSLCSQSIFGVRWLCANCPTQPTVDLCNECEAAGAGASHNLMHAWLRVCIPMTRPLQPRRALLPILYQRQKVASDRGTIIGSESDSVNDNAVAASDTTVHANVLCDECLQSFSSCWYRCATCPTSPDLCEACFSRGSNKHDMNHVYIKLALAVDMALFKTLTSHTSGAGARPLVSF